jgi:uroporphyrinogen decarboxylase
MRQAGRVLPEYRELKKKHSFIDLVKTPELAAEVTLQPVRRFQFDAAILFSDILVIPEALGQGYSFRDSGGISMEFCLRTASDLQLLHCERVREKLSYVPEALKLIKNQLGNSAALIGFSGSPWTLANFMIEGGSSSRFESALKWWKEDSKTIDQLMEILSHAIIEYLQMQLESGVDAIQIFDTLGGLLDDSLFKNLSAKWLQLIITHFRDTVPVIVFSKGPRHDWSSIIETGAGVVGIDHLVSMKIMRQIIPDHIAMQGNLDPSLLSAPVESMAKAVTELLDSMKGRNGYIFNLGHGVPPDASLENIQTLMQIVKGYPWENSK